MTLLPIVTGALGKIPKDLVRELEGLEIRGRVETIQITAFFLDRPGYCEESWKLEEDCCLSDFTERPSANAGVKNSLGIIMIILYDYKFN